jgi:hypothetical protein
VTTCESGGRGEAEGRERRSQRRGDGRADAQGYGSDQLYHDMRAR